MQSANNLNTSLNALNSGEAAALADINRRTTDANNAYNSGLASANAQIEADYIKNLLDQRQKELDRQLQERQFNESVRQFNENLALQKQQLYSRFSGGSGGGRRSYGSSGSSSNNENIFTDTSTNKSTIPSGYSKTNYTMDFAPGITSTQINKTKGGMSLAEAPLYKKGKNYYYQAANGKMVKVKVSTSKKKK